MSETMCPVTLYNWQDHWRNPGDPYCPVDPNAIISALALGDLDTAAKLAQCAAVLNHVKGRPRSDRDIQREALEAPYDAP